VAVESEIGSDSARMARLRVGQSEVGEIGRGRGEGEEEERDD